MPKVPPAQRTSLPSMAPGSVQLMSLRAPDPEGGLPWGIAIARSKDGNLFCSQVGRVQGGRLGVIGRDGTFNDDGRFHPLSPGANQGERVVASDRTVTCGSAATDRRSPPAASPAA